MWNTESSMHEDYYGFTEKPFSLTPDPKYLYKSASHASAFDLLQYAIRRREGFVVVTGDIGTGKTTLCRAVLEQLDRKTFTALVLNPFLSEEDLLRLILQDFGVVSRDEIKRGRLASVTKQELIETLNDFLMSLLPLGAGAVLILDEAQNLPREVLEQIRILSNLETNKEKLLQIVLVGQSNLKDVLADPDLRQLDQRVSIRYELKPLTCEETAGYIAHRVAIAGGSAAVTFDPKVVDLIHRYTGGIPRLINLLCDRSLLGGFSARTNRITADMVDRAAATLDLKLPRTSVFEWIRSHTVVERMRSQTVKATAGASAALAIVAAAVYSVVLLQAGSTTARGEDAHLAAAASASPSTPATLASATRAPQAPADQAGTAAADRAQSAQGTAGSDSPSSANDPAATAMYSVLVGSFRQEEEATRLTAQLSERGYRSRIMRAVGTRGLWYQVLVGPYAGVDQARDEHERVRQMPGYSDARLVSH